MGLRLHSQALGGASISDCIIYYHLWKFFYKLLTELRVYRRTVNNDDYGSIGAPCFMQLPWSWIPLL